MYTVAKPLATQNNHRAGRRPRPKKRLIVRHGQHTTEPWSSTTDHGFYFNRGFTLVEVMIAMLVLLVGLLGSLVGVMAAADYNLGNALRTEAVRIAQEQLENLRVGRYDSIAPGNVQIQRQVRKALYSFQVATTVTTNASIRQVGVNVQWTFKNRTRSYATETIIRQRTF